MPVDDSQISIDKPIVSREIKSVEMEEPEPEVVETVEPEPPPPPKEYRLLKELWAHSDTISTGLILIVAAAWIMVGMMVRHPVPTLIGATLAIPGLLSAFQTIRRAMS